MPLCMQACRPHHCREECTKRDIIHYYGIPADKISVIYQGCSSLYACRVGKDKRKEVMRSYRLPERYILSVGTIEERKMRWPL